MDVAHAARRFGSHDNAFGFLRLVFASLVIVSHTPEFVDGDRGRELLTRVFGTLSFGEFAVDAFFTLSGFLIAASYLDSTSCRSFLTKRVARVYPGFVLASLLCLFIAAPLAGGAFPTHLAAASLGIALVRMALLAMPMADHVFEGGHHPLLDGAAWTIQYEFLCYLVVYATGRLRLLRSLPAVAAMSAVSLLVYALRPAWLEVFVNHLQLGGLLLTGTRIEAFRLVGLFMAGSAFYLAQDRIPLRGSWMAAAAIGLALCLFSARTATIGFAIFGSYLVFATAALGGGTTLARINNRNDVSFGVYLYAWPVEQLLVRSGRIVGLVPLGLATLAISLVLGTISWFALERPVMRAIRRA